MKQKYHLAMDDAERRLLIGSLNNLRSRLFTEGRYRKIAENSETARQKVLKTF